MLRPGIGSGGPQTFEELLNAKLGKAPTTLNEDEGRNSPPPVKFLRRGSRHKPVIQKDIGKKTNKQQPPPPQQQRSSPSRTHPAQEEEVKEFQQLDVDRAPPQGRQLAHSPPQGPRQLTHSPPAQAFQSRGDDRSAATSDVLGGSRDVSVFHSLVRPSGMGEEEWSQVKEFRQIEKDLQANTATPSQQPPQDDHLHQQQQQQQQQRYEDEQVHNQQPVYDHNSYDTNPNSNPYTSQTKLYDNQQASLGGIGNSRREVFDKIPDNSDYGALELFDQPDDRVQLNDFLQFSDPSHQDNLTSTTDHFGIGGTNDNHQSQTHSNHGYSSYQSNDQVPPSAEEQRVIGDLDQTGHPNQQLANNQTLGDMEADYEEALFEFDDRDDDKQPPVFNDTENWDDWNGHNGITETNTQYQPQEFENSNGNNNNDLTDLDRINRQSGGVVEDDYTTTFDAFDTYQNNNPVGLESLQPPAVTNDPFKNTQYNPQLSQAPNPSTSSSNNPHQTNRNSNNPLTDSLEEPLNYNPFLVNPSNNSNNNNGNHPNNPNIFPSSSTPFGNQDNNIASNSSQKRFSDPAQPSNVVQNYFGGQQTNPNRQKNNKTSSRNGGNNRSNNNHNNRSKRGGSDKRGGEREKKKERVEEKDATALMNEELSKKLKQLQAEISRYQNETDGLAREGAEVGRLKQELNQRKEKLTQEREEFDRRAAEESKRLKRQQLELQQKERKLNNVPNRQERSEIEKLTKQITQLKREHKLREEKTKSSLDRLKNQVKTLTSENTELSRELKLLEDLRLKNWNNPAKTIPPRENSGKNKLKNINKKRGSNGNNNKKMSSQKNNNEIGEGSENRQEEVVHVVTEEPVNASMEAWGDAAVFSDREGSEFESEHEQRGIENQINTNNNDIDSLIPTEQEKGFLDNNPNHVNNPNDNNNVNKPQQPTQQQPTQLTKPSVNENDQHGPGVGSENLGEPRGALVAEVRLPGDKVERQFADGSTLTLFRNGTSKFISSTKDFIKVKFPNGDYQETFPNGRVVYFYQSAETTHISYPDGTEVYHFGDSQTEKHYADGTKEIVYADQTKKVVFPDGSSRTEYADGRTEVIPAPHSSVVPVAPPPQQLVNPQHSQHQQQVTHQVQGNLRGHVSTKGNQGRVPGVNQHVHVNQAHGHQSHTVHHVNARTQQVSQNAHGRNNQNNYNYGHNYNNLTTNARAQVNNAQGHIQQQQPQYQHHQAQVHHHVNPSQGQQNVHSRQQNQRAQYRHLNDQNGIQGQNQHYRY